MLKRPRTALLGAAGCLAGLVVTGLLAELVPAAQVGDTASLSGFASLRDSQLSPVLARVAHLADPDSYALLGLGVVLVALVRGRRRLALALPVVLVCAPATSEVLKHLTASPRGEWLEFSRIAEASWPSGHATAAMTLALCGVLAAPPRVRPLVATVGGLFAAGVAYAVVVLVWHFPSDVIGGFLVAALWTLLAVAALRRWPDPRVVRADRARGPGTRDLLAPAALAAFAIGAALALAFERPHALAEHVADHPSFAIAAIAIAALAGGLSAGLVRLTRNA